MFSLIIYGDGSQWDAPQPWSIDASRFLEHSCSESEELFNKSKNLEQHDTIPTLVTGEWAGEHKIARFGYVSRVRRLGKEIRFVFDEIAHATTELFDDFSEELQIHQWEYSRSYWAIKSGEIPPELISAFSRGTFKEFPYEILMSYAAGRHCLMFASENYASKVSPTFESTVEIARAISQSVEVRADYILADRFDQTEIPCIPKEDVNQALTVKSPEPIAAMVVNELKRRDTGKTRIHRLHPIEFRVS
jgi:hypothetical protein